MNFWVCDRPKKLVFFIYRNKEFYDEDGVVLILASLPIL